MKKLTSIMIMIMIIMIKGASFSEGGSVPDWFLPETYTPITTTMPAITETPAPHAFRFRDGIRWGMNTQQVKALEIHPMTERTMKEWSVMLTDGKVTVSRFTADLIFMFREDRLMMASYEFPKGSRDDFLYLGGALASVYGEKKDADALKIKALMDAINPNRYTTEMITDAYGWMTADGTTIFLYYYAADAFAITYVSPDLGKNAYQTNGL